MEISAARAVSLPRAPALGRLAYLTRIVQVYADRRSGPLSFWYEEPELNHAYRSDPRQYFMRFRGKASYAGPFDGDGIPLIDYRGDIGLQYNPIAIAQYGLARFNRWCDRGDTGDRTAWLAAARWLVEHAQPNVHGVPVWVHLFDWPYRELLQAPWYSGLAQGNGVSLLVRAAIDTGDQVFADAAHQAFQALELPVSRGGVLVTDTHGHLWIEEYIVEPPSHILNGFIWALWGVYDYLQWSGETAARVVWESCLHTIEARLDDFDTGWWSLYEAPVTGRTMLASAYYHRLHAVQLRVLSELTANEAFAARADRFEAYARQPLSRTRAFVNKAWFKLTQY